MIKKLLISLVLFIFLIVSLGACTISPPEIPIPEMPKIIPPNIPLPTMPQGPQQIPPEGMPQMPPGGFPKMPEGMPKPPWLQSEDTIETGTPTKATLWVTVPYNTPQQDMLMLALNGQAPIEMSQVGELSWETTIDVKGGDTLDYKYLRGSETAFSPQHSVKITVEEQSIYDAVTGWSDIPFKPQLPDDFIISIGMFDTWGRNYNFNMFESTRNHIGESFDRVKQTGVEEVYVTEFLQVFYDEDIAYSITSTAYRIDDAIFEDDLRDEALTEDDMKTLAREAHSGGLRIGAEVNIIASDIGKLIGSADISAETAKSWEDFAKPKTKEWVEDFFNKWEDILLNRAQMLNDAGFDKLTILGHGWIYNFNPHEEYANGRWKDIIEKLRETFKGTLDVIVDRWGFIGEPVADDWEKYDFYREVDTVYYSIVSILPKYAPARNMDFAEMKEKLNAYLDNLESVAEKQGIKVSLYAVISSMEDAILTGGVEISDILNPAIQAAKPDWQHQADAYEALFQAAENRAFISGIQSFHYWWDDAMDPDTTMVRISISPSPRNKPAEAVIRKWVNALK